MDAAANNHRVDADYDRLVVAGGGDFTRGVELFAREHGEAGVGRADIIRRLVDAAIFHGQICTTTTQWCFAGVAEEWAHGEVERLERHLKESGHRASWDSPQSPALRFRFVTDTELEEHEPPPARVDGVLFDQSLAVLVGPPEMYKSFIGVDLAGSVHCGEPWAGRATRRGATCYIVAEGRGRFGLRTRAWRAHRGLSDPIGMPSCPSRCSSWRPARRPSCCAPSNSFPSRRRCSSSTPWPGVWSAATRTAPAMSASSLPASTPSARRWGRPCR